MRMCKGPCEFWEIPGASLEDGGAIEVATAAAAEASITEGSGADLLRACETPARILARGLSALRATSSSFGGVRGGGGL